MNHQAGVSSTWHPMPHDHSNVNQGGAIPLPSISGHSKAVHDALLINADQVDGEHVGAIVTNARVKAHFPDTIANILSNHSGAVHDALSLSLSKLKLDIGAVVDRNGDQVIGTGVWTKVQYDTEVFDVSGNFAGNQFTAPSNGYHLLIACATYKNVPANTDVGLVIRVAGVDVGRDYREFGAFNTESQLFVATLRYMTATQIANGYVYHNRPAANVSLLGTLSQTFFCAVKVGV